MRKQVCLVALLFVSIAAQAARLPTTVIPSHLALTITPDLSKEAFMARKRSTAT